MNKTRVQMIIETLRANPSSKFTARELAAEFIERYPAEMAEKLSNPRYDTKEKLLDKIKEDKIEIDSETPLEDLGYGNLVDQLYKKVARPYVVNPIFLTEHPIDLSPLARANDENPNLTDRFQLVINGAEIINGYSELVDPQEQERRLKVQASLKAAGDDEAMPMDMDYISAMEYGMPPISGWGMGIDRMVQLLTNSANIKDVIMFPLMKNKDRG